MSGPQRTLGQMRLRTDIPLEGVNKDRLEKIRELSAELIDLINGIPLPGKPVIETPQNKQMYQVEINEQIVLAQECASHIRIAYLLAEKACTPYSLTKSNLSKA